MAIISNKMIDILQLRIQREEENSKAYRAMSQWLDLHGFKGAAKLWKAYAEDELLHKEWSVQYLLDLNILPKEPSQLQPQLEFKGLPQIIALSYEREIKTTEEVKSLAKECLIEGDMLTFGLTQKYIAEQVEELKKVQSWIDRLESFGDGDIALRMLDQEMGGV